jgi:hypothetical protein
MINDYSISKFRAEVIERTINIEWIINAIISQHYFGKVLSPFILEFLYDEYCTFSLKRRVLEKIAPNLEKEKLDNLNRINTIRNYFAHCGQVLIEGSDPSSPLAISKVVDPRKLNKAIDFEKLYSEFMGIVGGVEEHLAEIYKAKGGQLLREEDFKKA